MTAASPTTSRPPLWRDVRVLRWVGQIAGRGRWSLGFAVLAVLATSQTNLRDDAAAAAASGSWTSRTARTSAAARSGPGQSIRDAFVVGYFNTIRVIAVGIPAVHHHRHPRRHRAAVENALVRAFGTVYVETFRNIPPLVWIFLAFFVVLSENLPPIDEAFEPLRSRDLLQPRRLPAVVSSRARTSCRSCSTAGLGLGIAVIVAAWRTRVHERTGAPHHRLLWGLGDHGRDR